MRVEKQQDTWDKLEQEGGRVEAWYKKRKPRSNAKANPKKTPEPKRKSSKKPKGKPKPKRNQKQKK